MTSSLRSPGVTDDEEDDQLSGTFFNDMFMLDVTKGVWRTGERRDCDSCGRVTAQLVYLFCSVNYNSPGPTVDRLEAAFVGCNLVLGQLWKYWYVTCIVHCMHLSVVIFHQSYFLCAIKKHGR